MFLIRLYFKVQFSLLTNYISCDFCLNKFKLNKVRKVDVKFRYGLGLKDLKNGHAEKGINMCFLRVNEQPIC